MLSSTPSITGLPAFPAAQLQQSVPQQSVPALPFVNFGQARDEVLFGAKQGTKRGRLPVIAALGSAFATVILGATAGLTSGDSSRSTAPADKPSTVATASHTSPSASSEASSTPTIMNVSKGHNPNNTFVTAKIDGQKFTFELYHDDPNVTPAILHRPDVLELASEAAYMMITEHPEIDPALTYVTVELRPKIFGGLPQYGKPSNEHDPKMNRWVVVGILPFNGDQVINIRADQFTSQRSTVIN